MCFDFLYNFGLKHFSFYDELSTILSQMYTGLHPNISIYPLFLSDFNETWIFLIDFLKKNSSNIKSYENLPSGSRTVPCGQTDRHDKTHSFLSQCCNHSYKLNILYGLQMESKQGQPYSFNKTVHMLQFPQLMLPLDCSYFVKDLTDKMSCSL